MTHFSFLQNQYPIKTVSYRSCHKHENKGYDLYTKEIRKNTRLKSQIYQAVPLSPILTPKS